MATLGKNFFAYKLKGDNGKPMAGVGRFKYLSSKYKEPQNIKKYDFNKIHCSLFIIRFLLYLLKYLYILDIYF